MHIQLSPTDSGQIDLYYKLGSASTWPLTPTVSYTGKNMLTVGSTLLSCYNSANLYRATRAETGIAYQGLAVCQPDRELVEPYFEDDPVGLVDTVMLTMGMLGTGRI